MSAYALIACLILTIGPQLRANGQAFSRRYDAWADLLPETGFGIEHTSNGYILFLGSYFINDSLLYSSAVTTLSLDLQGSPIDTNVAFIPYKSTYPGWANVAFVLPGGGFGVGGGTDDSSNTNRPALYLFNATGVNAGIFEYGVTGESWIGRQGKATPDGGYVICGETSSSGTSLDAFLLKIDSTGAQEWVQTYGPSNTAEYMLSVDIAPNGGYYLGGTRAPTPGSFDHWVLMVDSLGNVIWDNTYGTSFNDAFAAHLESMQNGDLVFNTGWAQDEFDKQRLGMARIDPSGAVVWSKSYDSTAFAASFMAVKEILPSGDLITAGQSYLPGYVYLHGVMLRTNSNGDSLWLRYYHYYDSLWTEGKGRFLDVIPTPDGGFIAVGAAYGSNNPNDTAIYSQDTWVVKVDSMGCLVPGCDTVTGIVSLVTNYRNALVVAPNPAHEQVTLTWRLPERFMKPARLTIVNAAGAWMHDGPIDLSAGSHQVDVSGYPSGMYYVHVVQAGTWVTGAKVVVSAP